MGLPVAIRAPEGLYAHQLAHLCFCVAMGIPACTGSRCATVSWNRGVGSSLDIVHPLCSLEINDVWCHWVEERVAADAVIGEAGLDAADNPGLCDDALYYARLKLDHIISVPAMICLFLGIRSLVQQRR